VRLQLESLEARVTPSSNIVSTTQLPNSGVAQPTNWMAALPNSLPLTDVSLPGTYKSASGPSLNTALFGDNSTTVTPTPGPTTNFVLFTHLTANIASETAMLADGKNQAFNVLAGAAYTAALGADAAAGITKTSTGAGLVLSLLSDVASLASAVASTAQAGVTAADVPADTTVAGTNTTASVADSLAGGGNGTAAAAGTTATTADDASSATKTTAGGADAAAGGGDATAGGEDATTGGLDAAAGGGDTVAAVQGGVDPVTDELATGLDTAAAVSDGTTAAADVVAAAADVVAGGANKAVDLANAAAQAADVASQLANGAATTLDQAEAAPNTAVGIADSADATTHTAAAVSDGASAVSYGLGAASDALTADQFRKYASGMNTSTTDGGNSSNKSIQDKLNADAAAEASTHALAATAESAAAAADLTAAGLNTAAASANLAAVAAENAFTPILLQLEAADLTVAAATAASDALDKIAAADNLAATTTDLAAAAADTLAATTDTTAGVADAATAAADGAAGIADTAAIATDVTAVATAAIPFVDIATAAAAAVANAVAGVLDATATVADVATTVTDGLATAADVTATVDDGLATADDTTATAADIAAARLDAVTARAEQAQARLETEAAAANADCVAADDAAIAANTAAETADNTATRLNEVATGLSAAASVADIAFTGDAINALGTQSSLQTQNLKIADQLNAGVRSLDLRGTLVNNTINLNDGQYFTGVTLQSALTDMAAFLQKNPQETILVSLRSNEDPNVQVNNVNFNTDLNNLLNSTINDPSVSGTHTYMDYIYSSSNPTTTPTLGQVRGKIVIVPYAADSNSWTPTADPLTGQTIGWQPTQVVQDSPTVSDPAARWNLADTSGLIPTDLGSPTTLYTNTLSIAGTSSKTISDGATSLNTIANQAFANPVNRTTGIVAIDTPVTSDGNIDAISANVIHEIINENNLPIVVTSDSDAPGATGTLRAAINQANLQPGVNTIEFANPLTGPTGQIIFLQSDLPPITGNLDIAGPVQVQPLPNHPIFQEAPTQTVKETTYVASDTGPLTPHPAAASPPVYETDSGVKAPTTNYYKVTGLGDDAGTLTKAGHAGTQTDPFLDTTLRGAIAQANADNGDDTITFDTSTWSGPQTLTLSTAGDNTAGPSDFGITATMTIVGPSGNNGLTLVNSSSVTQRLFYISPTGSLTLENLTVTGGKAQGGSSDKGGGAAGMGGAIFNQGAVTLLQSTLTGNTAQGGASFTGSGDNGGGGLGGPGDAAGDGGGPNGGATGVAGANGGFGGGGNGGTGAAGSGGTGGFGGGGGGNYGGLGGFGGGGGSKGGSSVFGGGSGYTYHGGGGGAGMGGAIFNAAGYVTITNSTLAANSALGGKGTTGGSGFGGALFNLNGNLTLINDTLASNTVAGGSAIRVDPVQIGSGGSADGGALYTLGMDGVVASVGGPAIGAAADASVNAVNTLFANTPVGADLVDNNSTFSGSNNLASQSTNLPTGVTASSTALLKLGGLANNGGPTQTMALTAGSSAIHAGLDTTQAPYKLTTDQRGDPVNFPRKVGFAVDVGAFQYHPLNLSFLVTGLGDDSGMATTGHAGTPADPIPESDLRHAIADANADGGTETITFDPKLFAGGPQTITLSTAGDNTAGPSDFGIPANITIVGPSGNNGLTLANKSSVTQRLFYISSTGSLTLENLTLTGGKAQGGNSFRGGGAAGMGGAIFNQGSLQLLQSTLTGNTAQGGQGNTYFGGPEGGGGLGGAGKAGAGGGPNGGATGQYGGNGLFGGGGGSGTGLPGGGSNGVGYGGNGGFGGGGGFGNGNGGFGGGGAFYGNGGFGGGTGGLGGGGAGMGGAIFNAAGSVTITNSTLASNAADGGDGSTSGSGYGGAVFNLNGGVTLTNDTLAGNTVGAGNNYSGGSADGGALYTLGMDGVVAYVGGPAIGAAAAASVNAINTLFANSSFVNSTGGSDLFNKNSTFSGSNDLATQSTNLPTGVTATTTALLNLGGLANNGGPTQTMALAVGSSAIGAGLDTTAAPYNLTTDQRGTGFARMFGGAVDVGAIEALKPTVTPVTLPSGTYGANYSQTITATEPSGGAGGPYSFTHSGALPTGLSLASNGTLSGTTTVAGPFSFTITATDKAGFSGSQAYTVDVLVPTSVSVVASSATSGYGQNVTLTATVTTPSGDPTPSSSNGTVTFYDNGMVLGMGTLTVSGTSVTATLPIATLTAGSHTITASYSGDTSFAGSTSGAQGNAQVTVSQVTPTVSVSPVNIARYTPLANSQLSGTVTWTVGGTSVNVPGTFTYSSAAGTVLSAGLGQTEAVTFTPTDSTDYTTVSTTVTVNVQVPTSVAVSASSAAPVYGQNETFTATVTTPSGLSIPGASDGTVTFYDNGIAVGTPQVLSGSPATATLTIDTLGAGQHTITARYSGDSNFSASQSGTDPATQPIVLASGLNGPESVAVDGYVFVADTHNNVVEVLYNGYAIPIAAFNQPTAVSVDGQGDLIVTDGNGQWALTPYGEFPDSQGTIQTPGTATDSQGDTFVAQTANNKVMETRADGTQSTIGTGLNAPQGVAVDAAGDVFIADTGNNRVVEVPAGLRMTVSPATLTVTANPQTKVYGSSDPTLSYSVSGLQLNDTAADVISGSLTRASGETVSGGPYAISQGSLAGIDPNYTLAFTGSTLTITPAPLKITANSQTKTYGSSDPTLTYSVGGLQFGDKAATVLTGSLSRTAGEMVAGGPYTISLGSLTVADSDYTLGSFTGNSLNILPATLTVTVSATNTTPVYGQSDTFTATLTTPSGSTAPAPSDGTVTFYDGGAQLGTVPVSGSPATATLTIDTLGAGSHRITASYSGDSNYSASRSGTDPATQPIVLANGLNGPESVAVDAAGDVFIADTFNNQVVKVTPNGATFVIGGFDQPSALTVDSQGNLLITGGNNQLWELRPFGVSQISGPIPITFGPPGGAVDGQGDLFLAEPDFNQVVEFKADGTQTTVGSGLLLPEDVAVDSSGDVFIADAGNNRVVEVTPNGTQFTIGSFNFPVAVAVDSQGNLFLTDGNNQSWEVKSFEVSQLTTGTPGVATDSHGDTFSADPANNQVVETTAGGAQTTVGTGLNAPQGVAVDAAGDVFIADTGNNRVVEVTPSGTQSVVGNFYKPVALTVDGQGNLFITDGNNQVWEQGPSGVRQINSGARGLATDSQGDTFSANPVNNQVVEIKGDGTHTTVGSGLNAPQGVAVDSQGNVFIADTGNNRVVEVPVGLMMTVSPATLTVTANPQTKVYGSSDPTLTYSVSGLQLSDTAANVLGGSLSRASGEKVSGGPYAISQGSLTADPNYTLAFTGSTLTITPAPLTVVANSQIKTYGSFDPALNYTVYGLQFSDTAATVLNGSLKRASGETVAGGPYAISQGSLAVADPDYTLGSFTGNSLSILPAKLTVTVSATNTTPVYGQNDTFTATLTTPSGCTGSAPSDGTVTFYDGSTALGTATPSGNPAIATLTINTLGAGSHRITASYSGDSNFAASQSGTDPATQPIVLANGLSSPASVAVDAQGNVFIADTSNNRVVKVTPNGTQSVIASLYQPSAVSVNGQGDLFITDGYNQLWVLPPSGTPTQISSGVIPPTGVATDSLGDIFVADPATNQVVETKANGTTTTVGTGLSQPQGVAVDGQGDVFIADTGNNRVVKVTPNGTQSVVGNFSKPTALTVDGQGNLFIADGNNQLWELGPSGVSQITSGTTGVAKDSQGDNFYAEAANNQVLETKADGTQTTVGTGLKAPQGVAVDASGDVFIADTGNNRVVKVTPNGTQSVVGNFYKPAAVVVDGQGNLFITDGHNQLWEQGPSGVIQISRTKPVASDIQGDTFSADLVHNQVVETKADGTTTTVGTGLKKPVGVAVDAAGDVFIADIGNNQVVEVTPNGTQSVVGNFYQPSAVSVNGQGDLLITDGYDLQWVLPPNSTLTPVSYGGTIPSPSTATDSQGDTFSANPATNQVVEIKGDGTQTTVGSGLHAPQGVAVDSQGDVFIADTGNNRVVEVPVGVLVTVSPESLTINATSDSKTYDGSTFSSKTPTVVGTIYNKEVSYSQAFQSKDVKGSGGSTLVVSDTVSAGATADYVITTPTATGTISPESLAINATSDSKTYDGGTASSKTPTVVGTIYNSEVSYSQAFQSKHALGSGGSTLVVSDTVSAGATADYVITTNTATGTISPYAFTYQIGNDSQTFGYPVNFATDLGTTIPTGVNGENLSIAYSSTGDAASATVGTYSITATLSDGTGKLSDYNPTPSYGTLTVTIPSQSVYVLNATASGALTASGNAVVKLPGGVYVDSSSASAIVASSKAQVNVGGAVLVVGGVSLSGTASCTKTGTPPTTVDPFGNLPLPSVSGLTNYGAVSVSGTSTQTLNPGIYTSIQISGKASVTLTPGTYIIEGGGLSVSGNGSLSGSGVTIFNAGSQYNGTTDGGTFGSISIGTKGSITLSAPTTGAYAGVVIFQSRANSKALALGGSGTTTITGAVYAAAANVGLSANAQVTGSLVVSTLTLTGNAGAFQLADGTTSSYTVSTCNWISNGVLTVWPEDDTGNGLNADQVSRLSDAMTYLNSALGAFGVSLSWAADATSADVTVHFATSTPEGDASAGVIGFTTPDNNVYFVTTWTYYNGADPTQIASNQLDFETLAIHELAHTVGLGESDDANSVMYEYLAAGTVRRTFTDSNLSLINTNSDRYMKFATGSPVGAEALLEALATSGRFGTNVGLNGSPSGRELSRTLGDWTGHSDAVNILVAARGIDESMDAAVQHGDRVLHERGDTDLDRFWEAYAPAAIWGLEF
jgi:hypothetical protein